MNNTDKAKVDAARRMLLGKIDIEEVAMQITIKEEIDEQIRETYGDVDAYDIEKGTVIFDNYDDWGNNADIPDDEAED